MEDLFSKVLLQLESWPEWSQSKRLVLAISGGVDSMVLLHLMIQINQHLPVDLRKELVIAHFNHQLRPESNKDGQLIHDYIKNLDNIYFFGRWDNPSRTNIEATAREVRYQFFADAIEATESDTLMTAHHLNDLGETVLMRLMRGTSLKGISGIKGNSNRLIQTSKNRTLNIKVLRPLVHILKEQILEYANNHQIPYLDDHTNFETAFLRNRIRMDLIPQFESENPQFLFNLIALTGQLEASYNAHYEHFLSKEPEFISPLSNGGWLLYIPELKNLSPDTLQMFILILFEERLVHQIPNYNKAALKQVEQMIVQNESPNMTFDIANNWRVTRLYDYLRIEPTHNQKSDKQTEFSPIILSETNQWYKLRNNEMIGVFDVNYASSMMKKDITFEFPINLDSAEDQNLIVRHRQPGDMLTLQRINGTKYHKKVARVMIDAKIPRDFRENYWVVENPKGEVLCLLPHISKDFYYINATEEATHIIYYQNEVSL